jgi:phosphoglycerate dehydrogenase-like enzyme
MSHPRCFQRVFLPVACALALMLRLIAANAQDDSKMIAELGLREAAVPLRDMQGWHRPNKIVVAVDSDERLAWLREVTVGSATTLVPVKNLRELKHSIADADALVGPCIADVIEADAKLRWVQVSVASVENCLTIPSIRDGKVILTNMQRVNAATVAEHAMAMVLVLSRGLISFISDQHDSKWNTRPASNMIALEGKTMLIVGLGGVGTEIAQRAHAFRMRVIAIRNTRNDHPDFVEYLGKPSELRSLAGQADFIVNSTPLTKETMGLFDAQLFSHMRPTALFFNVGRGASVVTADLVDALSTGKIAGAGLDVVDPEPLPPDNPLWKMANVLITPHVADSSEMKLDRSWALMRENLRRYIDGGKLLSVVDVKLGY